MAPPSAQNGASGPAAGSVRRRRPSGEVHALLVDAARELFATRGYSGTSLRAIADRAGVSTSLLHRAHGTKAELFDEAIAGPFRAQLAEFASKYELAPEATWDFEKLARDYIEGMFTFLSKHRDLGRALVMTFLADEAGQEMIESPFKDVLARLDAVGEAALRDTGIDGVAVPISVRAMLGMTMSMAILPDLFFDRGRRRPGKARIIDEMVSIYVYGHVGRPGQHTAP